MPNNVATGKALRVAREQQQLTQGALGLRLGVSQGTISRLELGFPVEPQLLRKAIDLLRPEIMLQPSLFEETERPANFYRKPIIEHKQKELWGISFFKYSPSGASGDFVTYGDVGKRRFGLMAGDAVGSGPLAQGMAQALEYGFHAARLSAGATYFGTEGLRTVLEGSYRETKEMWEGPPSVVFAMADDSKGYLEVLNCGMPTPLVFSKKSADTKWALDSQLAALGSEDNPPVAKANVFESKPGDAYLFYSDGFKEAFESLGEGKLSVRFNEAAKFVTGDSKGILLNLIEHSGEKRKLLEIAEDDMCALVLCRKRETGR